MTPQEYMSLSAVTAKHDKVFSELVNPFYLKAILKDRLSLNNLIDASKKALMYGKQSELVPPNYNKDLDELITEHEDELHALLGIDTESAELIECLLADTLTREKALDEGGDLLWYLALLFRAKGITFEEAFEKNVAKLKARYPEGFSPEAAVNRNEAEESAIFSQT